MRNSQQQVVTVKKVRKSAEKMVETSPSAQEQPKMCPGARKHTLAVSTASEVRKCVQDTQKRPKTRFDRKTAF
jgi:hypothetical protein